MSEAILLVAGLALLSVLANLLLPALQQRDHQAIGVVARVHALEPSASYKSRD